MVRNKIHKIWNQPIFQGKMRWKHYFEGWYYKLVDGSEKHIHAFIPGVSLGSSKDSSEAFIQWLNGISGEYQYFRFDTEVFKPSDKRFEVWIGKNYFSLEKIVLDIDQDGHKLKGEVRLVDPVCFPACFRRPGIMGGYTFIPFMQCRHGIVSMNHGFRGSLEIDGVSVVFDGGKGYIEKDFGKSFPSAYIWMQCNHFQREQMSLMCSIATVPWLRREFKGHLCLLWVDGEFYNFSTYTKSRIKVLESEGDVIRIVFEGKKYCLKVDAFQDKLWAVKSPSHGELTSRTFEGLTSRMDVRLFERSVSGWDLMFEEKGRNAGIEMCDERSELIKIFNK